MDGNNRLTALLVVVVLLLTMCCCSLADFAEVPSPVTINMSEDQHALFRCRHEQPNAIISWLINGTSSSLYTDVSASSISESDGTFVYTLTIPTIPVYNGTEVVCVAAFIDGSPTETTPTVMLTITDLTTDLTTEPTTEPTTAPVTTEPRPNQKIFEITPSSLTVAVEQEVATFYCQHLSCDGLTWLVNGTSLNRINFPNITISSSGTINLLLMTPLLEHKGTTVQCVATFLDGSPAIPTPSVTLLIQDTPGKVENATCERNLSSSLLTTRWSSLPSLDLNDTDPDIVYSVELYKITCGEDIFKSREDVFVNSTNNTVDPMQIYKVIITARNNVEGARNGTKVEMREEFMTLNNAKLFQLTRNSQFNIRDKNPVPTYYTMILEPLDGHQEQNLMINISVQRSGEMVNMSVDGEIPTKTLWNASLLAYDCQSDTVVKGVELSTHDIQNISVTSLQPGEVRVTGDFIDGSTATGLLTIVISTSEIFYHLIERGSDHLHIEGSIQGVVGGEHSISLFVVEESGWPFERAASTPKVVSVEYGNDVNQPSIEYSLQSTSTGVCITCTFLDESMTECLTVIHQRVTSKSLNIIHSTRKLTRSGDTASGCIEGVNMEDYQVGVIGGRCFFPLIKDPSSSIEGSTVGIVLGVLVIILLAVAVVVSLIVVRKRKRTKLHSHIVDIEASGPPIPLSSDDVVHNQPGNEATVNNHYESITVTNHRESRTELDEMSGEVLEPLLSSTPLPTRQGEKWVNSESASEPLLSFPSLPMTPGENRVDSDGSSGLAPSSQDTIETDLSSPSMSNDDRILGDPGPLYDQPQLQGSTDVPPPTDLQHQSNEQESPPPVPLRTEDSKILVQESFNPSPSPQDNTSTNIQSPPDPTYAEPQLTGRAPVQTPSNEDQSFQSPPPLPPITQDREVLLEGFSESSPTQGSPHIAVSIDLAPPPDPTYAEPQLPAVNQPQSKEKQQMSPSGESCGPTYAQPVLSTASPLTSLPPVTEPVVYEDINRFKNSEGQHYAMLGESGKSKKTCRPDDRDQKPTVYVEIQPYSRGPTTPAMCVKQDTSSDKNTATRETHTCTDPPFTVEYIFPTLLFMASKWLAVGEALSLDEDRLDEIFTNNETDEACLRNMLEFYMERCGLKHSWEEIREASKKVEEKDRETEELEPTSQRSPVKKRLDAVTHTDPPFTIEYIFPTLLFMASKWEALGEALSLDEDRLDEIFTNNETDEACLHVMLEFYMERSDLKHNWEEIREAKKKVEEKDGETEELEPTSQRSSMNHQVVAGCNESVSRELENHLASPVPSAPTEVPPHHTTDVASSETHGQASSSSYQIPSYTNSEHDETEGSGADSDGHGDEQKFSSHYDVHVSGNELDELCPNPNTALCLHLDSQKQKIKDNPLLPFSYNEDRDREPTRDPSTSCQGDKSAYKVHQKKSNIKPVRKKGVEFSLPYSPACPKTKPDPERRADELCLKSNSGKVVYMYTKTKLVEEKHTSQVLKGDQIEC